MNVQNVYKYFICMIGVILICFPLTALAQIPRTISYQGYLTDTTTGIPVDSSPGTVSITFTIYDALTGGSLQWTETQDVAVNQGVYSVVLGSAGSPLTINFNTQYWLGIEVGTDGEMDPRQALTSVPYALNADTVDGYDANELLDKATYDIGNDGTIDIAETVNVPLQLTSSSPQPVIRGTNSSAGGTGVYGLSTSAAGDSSGVFGTSGGNTGAGVRGSNSSLGYGVHGSSDGYGVYGETRNASGYAIYGFTDVGTAGYFSSASGSGLIVENGNVGIGTTNAVQKLHVDGGAGHSFIKFTNATTGGTDSDGLTVGVNSGGDAFIYNRDATYLRMGTNNDLQLTVNSNGNIGVNDLFPDALFEVSASGGASDLFMLSSDMNNDGDLFIVKNSGNVGIGTTVPDETLVVDGNVKISGLGNGILFPDGTSQTSSFQPSLNSHEANASAHHAKTINAAELTTGLLPNNRIANSAIGTTKIANNAVTPAKLSVDVMQNLLGLEVISSTTTIGNPTGFPTRDIITLACPAGKTAISCGFSTVGNAWHVESAYPSGNSCNASLTTCVYTENGGGGYVCPFSQEDFRLFATCVNTSAL